jgi:hypothetical protein
VTPALELGREIKSIAQTKNSCPEIKERNQNLEMRRKLCIFAGVYLFLGWYKAVLIEPQPDAVVTA